MSSFYAAAISTIYVKQDNIVSLDWYESKNFVVSSSIRRMLPVMTEDLTTISLDSKTIPRPFQAFLRLRCRICKKKAFLIAARSKPMCERCYEIINYEYKMGREYIEPIGEDAKLASLLL